MDHQHTVRVTRIENPAGLDMTWDHRPSPHDIRAAFAYITDVLDQAEAPVNIIVNIQSDPQFPAGTTLSGAIGVQSHPMMGTWIVVGANRVAKIIGNTLTAAGKANIHWCSTMSEAIVCLQSLAAEGELHAHEE